MIFTVTLNASVDSIWKIENYNIGHINRVEKNVPLNIAGGKGINVARVINKLGGNVLATGFVGGQRGKFIETKLNEEKIKHEFIHVDGESRECLTIIDSIEKTETKINGTGPEISLSEIKKFKDLFLKILPNCTIVCLSGSLPPGVPKDIYKDLITLSNEKNVPVILDASNDGLKKGIIAKPFMVKPTDEEVEEVLQTHNIESDYEIIRAAKYFLDKGAELVIITRGAKSAIMCNHKNSWKIIPPDVKVISSVGSGDAFVGGFASGIAAGNSILDAFKLGIAAGAANAEKLTSGDISYDRVQELLEGVKWNPL